jgi:hypothetical protein
MRAFFQSISKPSSTSPRLEMLSYCLFYPSSSPLPSPSEKTRSYFLTGPYRLAQAFMQMIRERTGRQLDTWLGEVEASYLPELKSFAKGIQQDKAAVLAGLTLPWSQGPVEGHVNRLKLIKRSMYGRAKLPLLRQRVLRSA